ncbi:unnamed protein product [marine sediment metagenome]|uniref:Uncharacterized protein n=1 Tax=marine sediment metagenome TaxID=412755 RepID=X0WR43_9ZZZZ
MDSEMEADKHESEDSTEKFKPGAEGKQPHRYPYWSRTRVFGLINHGNQATRSLTSVNPETVFQGVILRSRATKNLI